MSAFEQAANARIVAAGVTIDTVAADTLRLEPFGSAFLLRWDGALILTADEVMQLLGATPGPGIPWASTQTTEHMIRGGESSDSKSGEQR